MNFVMMWVEAYREYSQGNLFFLELQDRQQYKAKNKQINK